MVRLSSLFVVAGGLGCAAGAMALLLQKERKRMEALPPVLKYAVSVVNKQPQILDLIGEPYEISSTYVKTVSKKDDDEIRVETYTNLIGKKDTAELVTHASKKNQQDRFKLYKMEMTFEKIKGKKLLIMDTSQGGLSDEDLLKGVDTQSSVKPAEEPPIVKLPAS